jgi:hypothetical protein
MRIRIEGSNLPGRSCAADGTFPGYDNIHVGIQRRNQPNDVVDLYAGDSPAAVWTFDATVVAGPFRSDIRRQFIQAARANVSSICPGAPWIRYRHSSCSAGQSSSSPTLVRRLSPLRSSPGSSRPGWDSPMREAIPCVPESSRRPWNGPPGSNDHLVGGRPPSQWRAQCALMTRLVSASDELEVWRQRARESILDLNDGIVTAAGIAEGFAVCRRPSCPGPNRLVRVVADPAASDENGSSQSDSGCCHDGGEPAHRACDTCLRKLMTARP